jgi:hypothetical protein
MGISWKYSWNIHGIGLFDYSMEYESKTAKVSAIALINYSYNGCAPLYKCPRKNGFSEKVT